MATYDDFPGVWMTCSALREYFPDEPFELLVLDNAPSGCVQTRGIVAACGGRYVHRPDLTGTSASRDALFRFARTDWVLVLDSHVLLAPGSIRALRSHIEAHPHSRDLV